ncbi:MAG: outer membrane beta-barrel protein [Chitinophagaceae bacterium]
MKKFWQWMLLGVGIFMASYGKVKAQEAGDMILNLDYNPSFPVGSFKDNIIGKTSWKGYGGDIMYHITDKWAAGLGFSYQGYREKTPRATYNLNGADVDGVLNTSVNEYPILAKAQFYPLGSKAVRPYIQVGTGVAVVGFDQYLGTYSISRRSTGRYMAQGGIGFSIPFDKLTSNGLQFGAHYNYINYDGRFTDQAGNEGKVSNLGSFNAYVGVHFALR